MYRLKALLGVALIAIYWALMPSLYAESVMLNSGVSVPITINNTVSSDNLKEGDMIAVSINKEIQLDGHPIFKKGGNGVLFVSYSRKSGGHGKAGKLDISGGKLTDLYGNDHSVNLSISSKGYSRRGGAILASVLGVLVILIPFGLWIDGKPVTLQGGGQYDALTTSATEIEL